VRLTEFISTLEKVIGKKAKVNKLPIQQGDVEKTWAGIQKARNLLEWEPKTDILTGIKKYIRWLKTL